MNIREISDIFKDTADNITAIKSYNFGWASDRVRQGNTEDFQELNEFPRVFFAVPTITGSDQTRKQDTYQVTLFFDDLLGYDNEGDEDPTLQIDKWANLQQPGEIPAIYQARDAVRGRLAGRRGDDKKVPPLPARPRDPIWRATGPLQSSARSAADLADPRRHRTAFGAACARGPKTRANHHGGEK